ncbi:MAG TPA: prepilin-type N-terminal cleavage/methylation domain-containing protein [Phycisphaerae bacterium]|nr:prepilin-type N-terminal cleavage/methylation domain-containing protein [Phycisphaerae bacterium]
MRQKSNSFAPKPTRAFTLIEIMVTIAIILILAVILLAVGGNVRRNAQISATRTELQGLAGLVERFQQDNPASPIQTTLYNNDASSYSQAYPKAPATTNYVDALYADPNTRDPLMRICGDNLKLRGSPSQTSMILDHFGRPISFIRQNEVISADVGSGSWSTPADRDYLRSSGPDQTTDWTNPTSAQNSDDVLSYEAAH